MTDEDTSVEINVLSNDSFEPGATVTGVTQGQHGTVTIGQNGKVTYTPDDDFHGSDSFTYTVTTAAGNTETETVNITVEPVQDIQDDAASTNEDTPIAINVLANDGFAPNAQVSAVTQGKFGQVLINPNGTIQYIPNPDFHGSDTFTYTVTSGGKTETATVEVVIDPIQDALADQRTTLEDTPITIPVLGNDQFSGKVEVTDISAAQQGQVSVNLDGTITYTPNRDFRGIDQFTYQVTTAAGNLETAVVTINVSADIDGDGIPNTEDLDDDNDGILDTDEQQGNPNRDTDGDGIFDSLDLDSDGDGITDLEESGLDRQTIDQLDQNRDGAIDSIHPFGKNGVADAIETQPDSGIPDYNGDGLADRPVDTDGDQVRDFQDLDADNDGINDVVEAGGQDADGNGLIDGHLVDSDGNGLADPVDPNQAGVPLPIPDTDGDQRADFRDLDSDSDGLPDLMEAGLNPDQVDRDRDGVVDQTDRDGDGIRDLVDGTPDRFGDQAGLPNAQLPDADGDSIPDYRELDSNGNGLPDRLEAKLPNGPNTPDANADGRIDDLTDRDRDGVADSIDSKKGVYGGFDFTDTDGDGIPDSADRDDDNDGILDIDEGEGDTDNDGIPDGLDLDSDNDGIPDVREAGGFDAEGDGIIDGFVDRNNDGLADRLDPNLGGIPLPVYDTDRDGKRDFQDRDSDNDGISDVIEAGGTDPDGDGAIGMGIPTDVNQNGLPDLVDPKTNGTPLPVPNTDGDGVADYRDLDSDNDSIPDVIEAGGTDPDGDGRVGTGVPVDRDQNGIPDSVDRATGGIPLTPPDADGDGRPNYRDLDSDNDGSFDLQEQGNAALDTNGDGILDSPDSDGDGLADSIDGDPTGFGSTGRPLPASPDRDNNGIPDFMEPPRRGSGSQGSDRVTGTTGNDILNGFSDLDILSGGDGNDIINGGSDADVLRGDTGDDILNGGSNHDDMDGGTGNDLLNGGTGNDKMRGGDGDDILNGGQGRDRMSGGMGNDRLNGNGSHDRLMGDEGNDWLIGDRGNDRLIGGAGNDRLTGGQGRDRFIYHAATDLGTGLGDTVTDFEILKDRFDLKQLLKGSGGSMQNVRFKQQQEDTLVQVSLDGWRNLALLKDVNAETLNAKHFIF
jgi:Ca2+-binding RTX toxin-like protein